MPKIKLTGHIDVPADRLAEVSAALPAHIALTRAEPGCIRFEVVASEKQAGRFLVNELFENRAAFDAHQARVKASDWGQTTTGISRHFEIIEID